MQKQHNNVPYMSRRPTAEAFAPAGSTEATLPFMLHCFAPIDWFLKQLKQGEIYTVNGRPAIAMPGGECDEEFADSVESFAEAVRCMAEKIRMPLSITALLNVVRRIDAGGEITEADIAAFEKTLDCMKAVFMACPGSIRAGIATRKAEANEIRRLIRGSA